MSYSTETTSGFSWRVALTCFGIGIPAYFLGTIRYVSYSLSGYCGDAGNCGVQTPTWQFVLVELLITAGWLGLVLLIVCGIAPDLSRRARVAGVLAAAAVFSAMVWIPLYTVDSDGGLLLILAAPFLAAAIAGVVAGDRRLR